KVRGSRRDLVLSSAKLSHFLCVSAVILRLLHKKLRLPESSCRMRILTTIAIASISAFTFAADDEKDFKPLQNGKDTAGRHLRNEKGHNSWTVEDGIFKNTVGKGEHGTDLVSDAKYWNFTVRYEYQVPDGSNSGFYLRGRHEIQILGDYK